MNNHIDSTHISPVKILVSNPVSESTSPVLNTIALYKLYADSVREPALRLRSCDQVFSMQIYLQELAALWSDQTVGAPSSAAYLGADPGDKQNICFRSYSSNKKCETIVWMTIMKSSTYDDCVNKWDLFSSYVCFFVTKLSKGIKITIRISYNKSVSSTPTTCASI